MFGGFTDDSFDDVKGRLHTIWFGRYRRGGRISNGFAHVYMGEMLQSGVISGYHRWTKLFRDMQANVIDVNQVSEISQVSSLLNGDE